MLGAGLNGFGKLGYQPCLSCTGQLYAVAFVSGTNSPCGFTLGRIRNGRTISPP